ncbi:vacuolar ATP synthase subunit D [Blastocystis sp. ATCC 50177/Nand II]|uniref:Vacuolar ATP synthase subunit D n=1 Tax=Blastocystis sp. subtype 1 (strain ATCC 50177 / NandII) TaxID=478820 RepID=A0A196SFM4_BLAHN|nr:vacuolar ATP synthase subunit D [Blastocystis sp. ATCC 50177/Nand II]
MSEQKALPTRMVLQTYKQKLVSAKKGYELLKKKSDALTVRYRRLLKEIIETKKEVSEMMKDASIALSEAKWANSSFARKIADDVNQASEIVEVHVDNVAGVKLPVFKSARRDVASDVLVLNRGGQQLEKCQKMWTELLQVIIRLSSLQTSFISLDEAIKVTNRRVNALDNVVIPGVADTIHYIESELDELEREDIFRLKKVLQVKKRKAAADAAVIAENGEVFEECEEDPENHDTILQDYVVEDDDIVV